MMLVAVPDDRDQLIAGDLANELPVGVGQRWPIGKHCVVGDRDAIAPVTAEGLQNADDVRVPRDDDAPLFGSEVQRPFGRFFHSTSNSDRRSRA